jgi:hypothetical protein
MRRRHPDVDHSYVRAVLHYGGDQRVTVAYRVGDDAAGFGEEPDETLPEKHRILGEHHTHAADAIGVLGEPTDGLVN